jgi:hypothetical protein
VRLNQRQEALGEHALRALALAEQGLALADAWAAFERDALATDQRLAPVDQRLDTTFSASPEALRTLCLAMHDRASRLLPSPSLAVDVPNPLPPPELLPLLVARAPSSALDDVEAERQGHQSEAE